MPRRLPFPGEGGGEITSPAISKDAHIYTRMQGLSFQARRAPGTCSYIRQCRAWNPLVWPLSGEKNGPPCPPTNSCQATQPLLGAGEPRGVKPT